MRSERKNLTCTSCGKEFSARIITQVDESRPEDQEANLTDGSLFTFRCPHCDAEQYVNHYLLWVDKDRTVAVCNLTCEEEIRAMEEALSALTAFGKASDLRRRYVSSPANLCEKTEIFKAGLDDRVVEIIKLYFSQDVRRKYPDKTLNNVLFFPEENGYGLLFQCPEGDLSVSLPKSTFEQASAQFTFPEPSPAVVDTAWAMDYLLGGMKKC